MAFVVSKESVRLALIAWIVGLPSTPLVGVARLIKQIRVKNRKNLFQDQGFAIISNHKGMWCTFVIVLLTMPEGLLKLRRIPWNVAAAENFKKFWWRWANPRMLFVSRDDAGQAEKAAHRVAAIIRREGVALLFLEGGRTRSIKSERGEKYRYSPKLHKRMRPFKRLTVQWLLWASRDPVMFVPVWTEEQEDLRSDIHGWLGFWPWRTGVEVRVGEPVLINPATPVDEAIKILEDAVFVLADQEF